MEYQTRNMTAARPMRYDRVELQPGDPFVATLVDARYLISTGRATFAAADPAPVVAVAPPASIVATAPPVDSVVAAEPAAPEAPAVAAEPMALGAADLAAPVAETPAATTRRPYTRRTPAKVEGS